MRILIDIGHPAHVHLFKNFALSMINKNHSILFTCREKEFELDLLDHYKFNYISFGKKFGSKTGKILGLLKFDVQAIIAGLKFKPDIFLSHGSMYAAHAAAILKRPHISFEDTFNFEQIRLYEPFTEAILTSDYEHQFNNKKIIKYSGYHELAYLHPNYFSADISVLNELGIQNNERYLILRFVSWQATHDAGFNGISFENKLRAIKEFEKYAKVFISSEAKLPPELEQYRIKIEPHRMHDALAFADLLFGESTTMAEECAMLGVPSCILYKHKTHFTKHLEDHYSLLYNFTLENVEQIKGIEKGIEILTTPKIKEEWQQRRMKMLSTKIDVTAFMVWFIENYPNSNKIMKE